MDAIVGCLTSCGHLTISKIKTEEEIIDVVDETKHAVENDGYDIAAQVVSQKGTCSFGHHVGDTVLFDGRAIHGNICLHALYSFLPKVFAMRYGADFPWLKGNKDAATHACPDAENPVVFEIRRVRK